MYYHAIRVSSVAMCNTWVWDASVLFSGLPLMFPFFSLYVPERFLMLVLLHICSGKVPIVSRSPSTCLRFCQTHEIRWFLVKPETLKPNLPNCLGDFHGNLKMS